MSSVGPSLLDFSRIAARSSDTSRIRVSDQNVDSTRLPTWASTNQAAMTAFVDALRRELGSAIADATATRLHGALGQDRPLTARMVRDSIDEAVRMANSRLNVRDRFLSDIDPQHGFSATFDEAAAPFRNKLDATAQASFRETMKRELVAHFHPASDRTITPESLARFIRNRCSDCSTMLGLPIAGLNGARPEDMANMALRMNASAEYFGFLCQHLPAMRAMQPLGELKPETIWQGLFHEPLPEGTGTGTAFRDALLHRLDTHLKNLAPAGKDTAVRDLCAHMPLDRARDIAATGRGVTLADLSAPERSLAVKALSAYPGERLLARDMGRRMRTTAAGANGATISTPPQIVVGDRVFVVGRETPFPFASEADRTSYGNGSPSTFSAGIMSAFRELCGSDSADPRQIDMLGILASQVPMRNLLGAGGVGLFKNIVNTGLIEHSATTVSVSRSNDGVAHVQIATSNNPDAVCFSGFARVSYDVMPDGTVTPTELLVEPVFGETAQTIVALDKAGVSNEEIMHHVAEALQAGTISQWEADQLRARLDNRAAEPVNPARTAHTESAAPLSPERESAPVNAAEAETGRPELPRITSKDELVGFLRGLPGSPVHGSVNKAGTATDFLGVQRDLYTFTGLVFRGDSRTPQDIGSAGGFRSKDDLSLEENMRNAQGLGKAIGATGTAGVSCATEMGRCLPYCDYGNPYGRGFVYLIDTSKLGEGRQAYDMAAISVQNRYKEKDESGGEVNITDIPLSAVVGWLEIPDADALHKGDDDGGVAALMRTLNPRHVHFNPQYAV